MAWGRSHVWWDGMLAFVACRGIAPASLEEVLSALGRT